jgi:hypothetical protein
MIALVLVVLGMGLVGCRQQTAGQPSGTRVAGSQERYAPVDVSVTLAGDRVTITPPAATTPVVLYVTNAGSKPVAVGGAHGGTLQPGETTTLKTSSVKAGTYTVYLPAGKATSKGVPVTIVVTAPKGGGAK